MAYEEGVKSYTRPSGANLSANQYKFVKVSGGNVVAIAAADDVVLGVQLNNSSQVGAAITVAIEGVVPVYATGAITAGAEVELTATGTVQAFSAGTKVGRAMSAASGTGSLVSILLPR